MTEWMVFVLYWDLKINNIMDKTRTSGAWIVHGNMHSLSVELIYGLGQLKNRVRNPDWWFIR